MASGTRSAVAFQDLGVQRTELDVGTWLWGASATATLAVRSLTEPRQPTVGPGRKGARVDPPETSI